MPVYKKRAGDTVAVSHTWNNKLDLIVENYISQSSLEKRKELQIIADSMHYDLKKEKYVTEKIELFHQSPTTIILGIVTRFQLPSLDTMFTVASFSGFILLRNHAYGISVILNEGDYSFEEKKRIIKDFIAKLEELNPSQ